MARTRHAAMSATAPLSVDERTLQSASNFVTLILLNAGSLLILPTQVICTRVNTILPTKLML